MKKKVWSIIIVIVIIIIIIGIWFLKNNKKEEIKTKIQEINSDFILEMEKGITLSELKEHKLPIILNFSADWCGVCKQMLPELKSINKSMQQKAIIKEINMGNTTYEFSMFPVEYVPTQFFINSDGTPYTPNNISNISFDIYKDEKGLHVYTAHVGYLSRKNMQKILEDMK